MLESIRSSYDTEHDFDVMLEDKSYFVASIQMMSHHKLKHKVGQQFLSYDKFI